MRGERSTSEIAGLLARRGLRATAPRRAILAYLRRHREHLAPIDIYEGLRRIGTPVSIATLYQNLSALVAGGLLRRFAGPDGTARYEVNLDAHHHLACERCGRIVDVALPADLRIQPVPARRHGHASVGGWLVRTVQVEFRGTCPQCRARRTERAAASDSRPLDRSVR